MRKAGKLHYDLQCLRESSWPAGFRKTRYDLSPLQSAKMVIGDLDVDGAEHPDIRPDVSSLRLLTRSHPLQLNSILRPPPLILIPEDYTSSISSTTSSIRLKSPNGVHVCMVFEVLSGNLLRP
jgi:hypothetical protein